MSSRATYERLPVAGHAEHLHVATVAERERVRRQCVHRGRPPFADESLGPTCDPHRSRSRPARWASSGSPSVHSGGTHPSSRNSIRRRGGVELAGHRAAGRPERGGDCGGGCEGVGARRDRTRNGREREHGRERASHAVTVTGGTREPGPSPGCRGCGAPVAPRARPKLRSGPPRVRVRPGRSCGRLLETSEGVSSAFAVRVSAADIARNAPAAMRPERLADVARSRRATSVARRSSCSRSRCSSVRNCRGLDHLALTSFPGAGHRILVPVIS